MDAEVGTPTTTREAGLLERKAPPTSETLTVIAEDGEGGAATENTMKEPPCEDTREPTSVPMLTVAVKSAGTAVVAPDVDETEIEHVTTSETLTMVE